MTFAVCSLRELQDTLTRDREKHVGQIEEFTNKYEELTKTFTETLANMEKVMGHAFNQLHSYLGNPLKFINCPLLYH